MIDFGKKFFKQSEFKQKVMNPAKTHLSPEPMTLSLWWGMSKSAMMFSMGLPVTGAEATVSSSSSKPLNLPAVKSPNCKILTHLDMAQHSLRSIGCCLRLVLAGFITCCLNANCLKNFILLFF